MQRSPHPTPKDFLVEVAHKTTNEQSPFGMPDLLVVDDEGYDTNRMLDRKDSVTSPTFASCVLSRDFGQNSSKTKQELTIEEESKTVGEVN